MDRLDRHLVVRQFDDEAHDGVGTRVVDTARSLLVSIGERGFEPVVSVGEHERRARHDAADRGDRLGVVDRGELVADVGFVGARSERRGAGQKLGETGTERESPDGVDVHPHRSEEREAVGLRLGQRAFVG